MAAIRLRALAEAPDAFGTTLAEDKARPPTLWQARLENPQSAYFLAVLDGEDVGLVRGAPWADRPDDDPEEAGLFSMWVAPAVRGAGVAGTLIDRVVAWAREAGFKRMLLGVGDTNLPAIGLYARKGFVPTGEVSTLPAPREHITEHERALRL